MQEMRETVQSAGQYALHRLDATLSIEDPQHNGISQWRILTRAQVLYSDGNTADVKIGNLVLLANPEGGSDLENPSSSANSDGTVTQVYTVQKDGTIEVKGYIASAGEMENFSMTLNGEPIPAQKEGEDPKRLTVKTGDVLTFQSHWIGKEEDQSPQVFHSGVAVLSYIGKDGGEQVRSFENEYRKRRELRFIDVWKYSLKEEAFQSETGDRKILCRSDSLASIHINLSPCDAKPALHRVPDFISILQKERQAGFFQMDVKEMRVYRAASGACAAGLLFTSCPCSGGGRTEPYLVADSVCWNMWCSMD